MAAGWELTGLQVALEAGRLLESYGYFPVPSSHQFEADSNDSFNVYEDEVSLVAIVGYASWPQLTSSWLTAQDSLGRLMGERLDPGDAKSWDAYLLLVIGQSLTGRDRSEARTIRYNTRRARKIVISGDEVRGLQDLELALMPVRPITPQETLAANEDPLVDLRRQVADDRGGQVIDRLLGAYRESRPLVETLHEWQFPK